VPPCLVGCMGWSYEDWVGPFYPVGAPASEFLPRYARVFDLTEVDSTFYRTPSPFLTRRWAAVTPPGFRFTAKIPREVTHDPIGPDWETKVAAFLASLTPLREAGKLGPLVAQFPPSMKRSGGAPRLERLLGQVPPEYRLAVELRHNSWWVEETFEALEARGAALVWSVYPGVAPPFRQTADFLYSRFVGDRALTKFDHLQRDLRPTMQTMVQQFREQGRSAGEIYALVNNHFMGFGPGTARLLQEILGQAPADLSLAGRDEGQRRLTEFS
jgi:uncharacterized protein YecE (DUF72 family)